MNFLCRTTIALALLSASLLTWAQELTVSAAASLTESFKQLAVGFEAAHPGSKVLLNFAASGPLLQQIRQGAPVDVFASADQETMDRAQAEQLLQPGTRQTFARNQLVLILPSTATQKLQALGDLSAPAFQHIATGNPATVPVGRYTQEAVATAGLTSALASRWIFGDSVRQVLNYVARGEVEAGFVYQTDALTEKSRVRVAAVVPTKTAITYPIAQIKSSRQPALAQAFISFVLGPDGQKALEGHGFAKP